ncbi:aldehyde ferredoxin oxidoreductase family protein, partial [Chloroflexota bacterium]
MANGNMGKVLFVDLTTNHIDEEVLGEDVYRHFLGGYGLGVKVLYERMKPGIDPLGPENILGFITGPLTGTGAISSGRFTVVAKSPLTGMWGDANCGGKFGVHLKRTGYDAIFFSGKSERPVYLYIDNGQAEIRDAADLWGKDTYDTERAIKAKLYDKVEVACIGPSGEKLSLISCVITDMGRAAGRSGLGAVMGSKNLKAVVVKGTQKVQLADRDELNRLNKTIKQATDKRPSLLLRIMKKAMMPMLPFLARRKISFDYPSEVVAGMLSAYGTCAGTAASAAMQDSPIKNWAGGQKDFPMSRAAKLSDDSVIRHEKAKYGCHGCPIKCGGIIEQKNGPYALKEESHKPEYETLSSFGSLCLNDNLESVILANDICNRKGLDTISAGAVIAFAIECYEEGILTREDTGVELKWGDHEGMIALLRLLGKREGFGDILADGVKAAASKIGKGSERFAIHVGGQELPMHDPKFTPGYG